MNERFWEIVEQADEQGGDDPDIRDELFAKLIVLECADYLSKNGEFNSAANIKHLFGIEK